MARLATPLFFNVADKGSPTTPLFKARRLSYAGAVYDFEDPVWIGRFVNGEPCLINDSGAVITTSPTSEEIAGKVGNGAMINPYWLSAQGFDELGDMPINSRKADKDPSILPYNGALNAALAPIELSANEELSIVKAIRTPGLTTIGPSTWQHQTYSRLHVLNAPPPRDAFPPAVASPAKTIHGVMSDEVFDCLQNLGTYSSYEDPDTIIGNGFGAGKLQVLHPPYAVKGEQRRRINVYHDVPEVGSNYSGGYAVYWWHLWTALHTDASNAQKREAMIRCITHGINDYGEMLRGWPGGAGAGQHFDKPMMIWIAAFALKNADMLAKAKAMLSGTMNLSFWVEQVHVGRPTAHPDTEGRGGVYQAPWVTEQIGLPCYTQQRVRHTETYIPGSSVDGEPWGRYADVFAPTAPHILLNMALMRNGPGGVSGLDAMLDGGAFDATNSRAAPLAFSDRMMAWQPTYVGGNFIQRRALYHERRAHLAVAPWTGKPDVVAETWAGTGLGAGTRFPSTPDGFSYDFTGLNYATETLIRWDLRYGHDGVSWVYVEDCGTTGSITGLPIVAGVVQIRQVTASGAGPWSYNFPWTSEKGGNSNTQKRRGIFLPTGSPANLAPSFAAGPVIAYKPYPLNKTPIFLPGDGALPDDASSLYLSPGVVLGHPAPTLDYTLYRNDVSYLTGTFDLTADEPTTVALTADDLSATFRLRVDAENTQGTAQADSAEVVVGDGGETLGLYIPQGTIGDLPSLWTERYNGSPQMTFTRGSTGLRFSAQTTAATRLWMLDSLLPIGSLANIPEGDMLLRQSGENINTSPHSRMDFAFRMSGTSIETHTGYVARLLISSSQWSLTIRRIVNNVATNVAVLSSLSQDDYEVYRHKEAAIRVNWRLVGDDLQIRVSAWNNEGKAAEPDWMLSWTDTSPLASGRLGFATEQSVTQRTVFELGLSTDPEQPAIISSLIPGPDPDEE